MVTYRFLPRPLTGHEVRPDTIPFVIKLTVWFIIELVFEVSSCELVMEEDTRISSTQLICLRHPTRRVGR